MSHQSFGTVEQGLTQAENLLRPGPSAAPQNTRRIRAELRDLKKTADSENKLSLYDENNLLPLQDSLQEYIAKCHGAPSTPYEGGIFYIRVSLPDDYPMKQPKIRFLTKIYHPNVHVNGDVCVHGLEGSWSPASQFTHIVLWTMSLLSDPDLDDPMMPEISQRYMEDIEGFEQTAREWTRKYATGELIFFGDRDDGFCNTTGGMMAS